MSIDKSIIAQTLNTEQGAAAYRVCERLLDAGNEAWWVGGCVRDMAMGAIPEEIDIATDAAPPAVAALFPRCDESASDLGSVIVAHEGCSFEITTFREDAAISDGRIPESVRFTDRAHDAERRDITINAMYWNPISSELWDPFEGEKDLGERLIRFIGDPETRIRHDALRMLRVIRFRATIGGQYHPDTFSAVHALAPTVSILSGSRCFRELEKILLGPNPETAFEDLWEADLIEHLLPELHACKGVAQPMEFHKEGDVWSHSMKLIASFTDDHGADVRWAGLFHDIGKPPTFSIDTERIRFNEHAPVGATIMKAILNRLQCPASRRDKICWLIGHHMTMSTFLEIDDERKSHWYYHPWFLELLQLFWLDIAGSDPSNFDLYERIISDYNHFLDEHPLPPRPLLSGHDVMEILGISPGEQIGRILKALYDAQIRGDISTKKEAIEWCKTHRNN